MGASSVGNLEGPLTVESMAVDALAVLDACGIGEAVLVGWSMGGFVAQALARAAPQRVQALALLATDPGGPEAVRADPAVWARLVDHAGSPREQATRLLHLLFPSPLADAVDAEVGDLVAAGRARIDPRVLTAQETAIDRWHAASPLPALPALLPTIAVAGSEDMVIPASNLALLAARWPGCRTTCIAGAGHAVMAQESERVAALVRDLAL
jgi:pimeloyl-ACP methyl ester carboxylesterase